MTAYADSNINASGTAVRTATAESYSFGVLGGADAVLKKLGEVESTTITLLQYGTNNVPKYYGGSVTYKASDYGFSKFIRAMDFTRQTYGQANHDTLGVIYARIASISSNGSTITIEYGTGANDSYPRSCNGDFKITLYGN